MPRPATKSVLVRMPAELKRSLSQEVERRDSALNDVAVSVLARRFGVAFEPTGRRGSAPGESPVVVLRMPPELKRRLQVEAFERGSNTNRVIVQALAEDLDVRLEPAFIDRVPFGGGKRATTMAKTNGSTNGAGRSQEKVRVAIIGVGNCANSLLQGVEYYKDADPEQFVPGLMHVDLGGYHVRDIEFTAAFDVVKGKVGPDLAEAIWAKPNDTIKFADVKETGVKVSRGMTHDGLGKYLSQIVEKAPGATADIVGILKETGTDVVVNYLPVGSEQAAKWYTEQLLERGRGDGQLHARLHRAGAATGRAASRRPASRSSATTSSRRSARRSRTAC